MVHAGLRKGEFDKQQQSFLFLRVGDHGFFLVLMTYLLYLASLANINVGTQEDLGCEEKVKVVFTKNCEKAGETLFFTLPQNTLL